MPDIELQEGETLEDAVKRIAKGMAPEEKPKKAPAKKKSAKSKPHQGDPTPPVEVPIYAAFHMYLLPDQTPEKQMYNARQERKMYGPGVLVFVHNHQPGTPC